jgi:CRISPR-associated endonuclease Cas1/group II intron reverse transcriptase/maturase
MAPVPGLQKRIPRLFRALSSPATLAQSWREIVGRYERDRLPPELAAFDRGRPASLERLSRALADQSFIPEPAALIYIDKPGHAGEQRRISLIRPEDRVILSALHHLLDPIFDRLFPPHSYAYRKGRSASAAIEKAAELVRQGLVHAATLDIDDFFDSIDRDRLLSAIRLAVWEPEILRLLELYLHIGATRNLDWVDTGRGIAQGSPLSPLLSNVCLLEFDGVLESTGAAWLRYADNILLLAADRASTEAAAATAERFLAESLGLRLNPDPGRFASEEAGFVFLGFQFRQGRRLMSPAKFEQKKAALAARLAGARQGLPALVRDLGETASGWRRYYGGTAGEQLAELQQHLFDLMVPWLAAYRKTLDRNVKLADLKAQLLEIELPSEDTPRGKLKWVELLLVRSRPEPEPSRPLPPEVRKAVERRKREVRARKQDCEELVVAQPGSSLGRTGERVVIRREGKREREIPLALVRNITLLTRAVSISGELMAEAAARGIAIHLLSRDGKPLVRIAPPESPSFHLSLAQTRMAASASGLDLARILVAGKIGNQANLLRYYSKYGGRRRGEAFDSEAARSLLEMDRIRKEVEGRDLPGAGDLELERGRLFAAEGQAAAAYWRAVKALLRQEAGFDGRVRRGATDLVNSLLNYGYGILYARLLGVLLRTGLNVNIGFLHKPQPGKTTLLFDFIEEFRSAAVDRVVITLLNLGKSYAVTEEGLPGEVRQEIAQAFLRRLQAEVRYHGEHMPLIGVMERQAGLLVRHIEGRERYAPFVMPW